MLIYYTMLCPHCKVKCGDFPYIFLLYLQFPKVSFALFLPLEYNLITFCTGKEACAMAKTSFPSEYRSLLSIYETQRAISLLKRLFEDKLSGSLRLHRVSAPLFVATPSGLNDDLSGAEKAVSFQIDGVSDEAQVVHSLAKWKRMALCRYDFHAGEGLYTDMDAIRRNEELDNLHSAYVDQWDWEKIIRAEERTPEFLKATVQAIVDALCDTQTVLRSVFPQLMALSPICREVTFITSQELADQYPNLTPKERENAITKEHKTVFLMQIGGALRSGKAHDMRAPDYDDWSLNGDILVWHDILNCAVELSSMGIRVDPETLDRQLTLANCDNRRTLPFHKELLSGNLPLTIGGGIGQSRVSMVLLGKAHVGEVQASLWDEDTIAAFHAAHVTLL